MKTRTKPNNEHCARCSWHHEKMRKVRICMSKGEACTTGSSPCYNLNFAHLTQHKWCAIRQVEDLEIPIVHAFHQLAPVVVKVDVTVVVTVAVATLFVHRNRAVVFSMRRAAWPWHAASLLEKQRGRHWSTFTDDLPLLRKKNKNKIKFPLVRGSSANYRTD